MVTYQLSARVFGHAGNHPNGGYPISREIGMLVVEFDDPRETDWEMIFACSDQGNRIAAALELTPPENVYPRARYPWEVNVNSGGDQWRQRMDMSVDALRQMLQRLNAKVTSAFFWKDAYGTEVPTGQREVVFEA